MTLVSEFTYGDEDEDEEGEDMDKDILKNINSAINIDKDILENINIDKDIPENIPIDTVEASIVPHSELFFKMLLGYLVFGLLGKKR